MDGLFDVFLGGVAKLVAAALCMLIYSRQGTPRAIHLKRNKAGAGRRAVDYMDALLFSDELQERERYSPLCRGPF